MASFKDIGKVLIGKGLPLVGSLIGGRTGESFGQVIASALGVENKPDQIMAAIEKDPNAAIKLKEFETQIALNRIERDKAEIQHDTTSESEAAQTIRVEASSSDAYVRRTRPMIIRQMFYLTAFEAVAIILLVIFGDAGQVTLAKDLLLQLFLYTAGLCGTGVTGYTLSRMREKNTAMNPQPGAISTLISGLRK